MKATIYRSHCHSDQFDNVSRAMMAKESAKKCTSHVDCLVLLIKPVVFVLIFSRFLRHRRLQLKLASTTISLKNRRFDLENARRKRRRQVPIERLNILALCVPYSCMA